MPEVHNAFVDLNFTHTRVGALVVTIFVVWLATARPSVGARAKRASSGPALLLAGLLVAQLALGMFVIWNLRPPCSPPCTSSTARRLLATTVLLAVRASRGSAAGAIPSRVRRSNSRRWPHESSDAEHGRAAGNSARGSRSRGS